MTIIAPRWANAFSWLIPQVTKEFHGNAIEHLQDFCNNAEELFRKLDEHASSLPTLSRQYEFYKASISDINQSIKDSVSNTNKDVNRTFIDPIEEIMEPAYEHCMKLSGAFPKLSFDVKYSSLQAREVLRL